MEHFENLSGSISRCHMTTSSDGRISKLFKDLYKTSNLTVVHPGTIVANCCKTKAFCEPATRNKMLNTKRKRVLHLTYH